MFNFLKGKSSKTPEEKFWIWFVSNKLSFEKFIDSENKNYSIFNDLNKRIKKYNSLLFGELTKSEMDKYIFIITPDGIKDGVDPTKALAEASPIIPNWQVKKFRQPTDEILLNFNGIEYPAEHIEVLAKVDHNRELVDIKVFIKNMNEDISNYQRIAFLYLDHILGEFNTITKVGYIEFINLEENQTVNGSISLFELKNIIISELY